MNLLVTGGAGFIGSNFIRLLMRETDFCVVNFDLLTYAGRRCNCSEYEGGGRYFFVQGDIAKPDEVRGAIEEHGVDAVVNFAAESHVDRSIHDASDFIRTNILGTQVLIDAARAAKIERFVHVSTDEVYGDLTADEPAFTERSPIKPSSPYAASKAAADLLIMAAFRTHRFPAVVTRCSNNYGPYQFPEKFIPLALSRAQANEPIPVYGEGTNVRDWIHVEDHCRGVLAALDRGRPGEAYNFGGDCEKQNIEVVRKILALVGRSNELIRFVTDRPGHDLRYAMNFEKAGKELGWRPRMNFETGLQDTIGWYAQNVGWLKAASTPEHEAFFAKNYGEVK